MIMKRFLISFICFISFAALSAQNYSELDLIGEWELSEGYGLIDAYLRIIKLNVNGISSIYGSQASDLNQIWGELDSGSRDITYLIEDIFVANGNILHMTINRNISPNSKPRKIRIIIKSIDSGVLTLSSIDGNYTIILKKSDPTNVAPAKTEISNNNVNYNLQGMEINSLDNHEVYIHNGKKYISKR